MGGEGEWWMRWWEETQFPKPREKEKKINQRRLWACVGKARNQNQKCCSERNRAWETPSSSIGEQSLAESLLELLVQVLWWSEMTLRETAEVQEGGAQTFVCTCFSPSEEIPLPINSLSLSWTYHKLEVHLIYQANEKTLATQLRALDSFSGGGAGSGLPLSLSVAAPEGKPGKSPTFPVQSAVPIGCTWVLLRWLNNWIPSHPESRITCAVSVSSVVIIWEENGSLALARSSHKQSSRAHTICALALDSYNVPFYLKELASWMVVVTCWMTNILSTLNLSPHLILRKLPLAGAT